MGTRRVALFPARTEILALKIKYFYPWHSWIARQTPTLKVNGSNPFG